METIYTEVRIRCGAMGIVNMEVKFSREMMCEEIAPV